MIILYAKTRYLLLRIYVVHSHDCAALHMLGPVEERIMSKLNGLLGFAGGGWPTKRLVS